MAAVGVHGFRSPLGREPNLRRFSRGLRWFVLASSDHHARRGFDGCGLCSYSALYAVSGPFVANRIKHPSAAPLLPLVPGSDRRTPPLPATWRLRARLGRVGMGINLGLALPASLAISKHPHGSTQHL